MKCPFCSEINTQVVDSRESDEGVVIRRRRRCPSCDKRFTTYERVELKLPYIVKRNGNRVVFERHKLADSLSLALRKRSVETVRVEKTIDDIIARLMTCGESEISSQQLGAWVMDALNKLDKVAYIRYASVYRNFQDIGEFSEVVREVQGENLPILPKAQDKI